MNSVKPIPPRSPWSWIPTLYFAEGLPYTAVMLIAVVFYKRMGISNTEIALYTSWLYLPWVIKPFWSPVVEVFRTKRFWIVSMQLIMGFCLGAVVLTIPSPMFFKLSLGFLWLLAFSSATHDIAADGFYMLGLSDHDQALFVGIRSTFYRFAMIAGQGLLIMFAGIIESHTGLEDQKLEVFAIHGQQESIQHQPFRQDGPMRLVVEPAQLEISIGNVDEKQLAVYIEKVQNWNAGRSGDITGDPPPIPLLNQNATGKAGNTQVFWISLSKKPTEQESLVANLGQSTGSKGLRLITDTRVEFNQDNWNKPYLGLIQHDSNLKQVASSVFRVRSGNIRLAWSMAFLVLALLFAFFFMYHSWILPRPEADQVGSLRGAGHFFKDFVSVFSSFFTKDRILLIFLFIVFYRLGEAQLVKIAPLFMIDSIEAGGLAITTAQYGFIYGTLGTLSLTFGGILGGWVVSRSGLKFWILWMALAMNVPDILYVILSHWQPDHLGWIAVCVCIEQFGYGFGFTAFLLFMITVSEGPHKTAHYALCTGIMALGMMIPGMFSGWLQEILGYKAFFWWVLIACLPGIAMIKFLKIDPEYGKETRSQE